VHSCSEVHFYFVIEIVETPEKVSEECISENNNNSTPSKSFAPTHPTVRKVIAEKLVKGKTAAAAHRLVVQVCLLNSIQLLFIKHIFAQLFVFKVNFVNKFLFLHAWW